MVGGSRQSRAPNIAFPRRREFTGDQIPDGRRGILTNFVRRRAPRNVIWLITIRYPWCACRVAPAVLLQRSHKKR